MNKITTRNLPGFINDRGIGFSRIFDLLEDAVSYGDAGGFPPYNVIEIDEDTFEIELALAGFDTDDIKITQDRNLLKITGDKTETSDVNYKFKGISNRAFSREFVLADHVFVDEATFKNGIVTVHLHRELPEEMKPRQIEIK